MRYQHDFSGKIMKRNKKIIYLSRSSIQNVYIESYKNIVAKMSSLGDLISSILYLVNLHDNKVLFQLELPKDAESRH